MKTTIKKWGINGEGIAYIKGKPVFIDGAIPGEMVEFSVAEEKEKYEIGKLENVIQPSNLRHSRPCQVQECQGCSLMHVNYKGQCKMKEAILKQTLAKYAGYTKKIAPIIKNERVLGYRNSCKLPVKMVDQVIRIGMYQNRSNQFVPLPRCIVHQKNLEIVRQEIESLMNQFHLKEYDSKTKTGIRTLVLKEFEEKVQVIFVTGDMDLEESFIQEVSQLDTVGSVWQSIKTDSGIDIFGKTMRHLAKDKDMKIHLHQYTLNLLPRSFYQLNTRQAVVLYDYVQSLVRPCRFIVEAYSGIGAMSLMVSSKAKRVLGIEVIEDAVINANQNARNNHLEHVSFVCYDAANAFLKVRDKVDCLIVDPPRSGLDSSMRQAILKKRPSQLIYISCNPSTLAKDLKELKQVYHIVSVQPFDMFSQTQHVETVCLLEKKK